MCKLTISGACAVLVCGGLAYGKSGGDSRADDEASAREQRVKEFCDGYLDKFAPLSRASAEAWWEAAVTGTDEAFARRKNAEAALLALHGDRETFAKLKEHRAADTELDPVLKRQLDVMYSAFLPKQGDPKLQERVLALEGEVDQIFNTHRSLVAGKELTENEVREILSKSTGSTDAEAAWKGYMAVGAKIAPKLKELVGLRNRIAREVGYENFFSLKLATQEIDEAELFKLFDELDALTREPFAEVRGEIDRKMAARFGIAQSELRPWHFGDLFFQEAPDIQEVNLDDAFADADILEAARRYFASLGMPVDSILERSDLYEKKGKSPHAFCSDLDRTGDVRILCNLKPNTYWMDTLVHELGHAVYDTNLRPDLPFNLRTAAHAITTEGIAMMFGAMVKTPEWYTGVLQMPKERAEQFARAAKAFLRTERLIFSRWAQVVLRFEHGLYTDPRQELGKLWWDLKKRYQLLPQPDEAGRPDYAAKMHIVGEPVYYHCYMIGELFASQVREYLCRNVAETADCRETCFLGRTEVGEYLRDRVFGPGNMRPWYELPLSATGERLSPKYFARHIAE